MLYLIIPLSVLGGLVLLFFIFLFSIYVYTFYSPFKGQNNERSLNKTTTKYCDKNVALALIERTISLPYEDVYITSCDKKKLHAKVYRNEKSDVVCLMLHGYRGTARRDFSGGTYEMVRRGFNVVLIDHRAHDKSKGHTITFGIKEQKDVKSWLNYIKNEFGKDKKVILIGISMGGGTALLSCDLLSEKDLLIADCPYSSPQEVVMNTIREYYPKRLTKFLYFLLNLSLIIFGHANLNSDTADNHLDNCKCPILIIHGSGDTLVPYQFSYRLKEKYPDIITYELFDGVQHGLCYLKDTPRYNHAVDEFLKKHL